MITVPIDILNNTVTINGNGYSIIGPSSSNAITVVTGTLELNDITIRGAGRLDHFALSLSSSQLDARNVVFRDNRGYVLAVGTASTANLRNVQFLNNGPGDNTEKGSAITVQDTAAVVNINGATFRGNRGFDQVIRVRDGTVNISGCIRVSGNEDASDQPAAFVTGRNTATINDNRSRCKSPKKEAEPTATRRPPAATCIGLREATGIAIHAAFGLHSGVQCQQLDGGGIGIQALAENYISAVDIWGYVDQGIEVCFPQAGRLIFLDARTIPRSMSLMQSHISDGMTCASIETPGSIVLLPPE